ncbi:hypothetical protein TWF696_001904 [Orbilia brochopaga]|uniref:Uncharacterized protein n=1 Tax=Orbilia brochopaga TaxID=3140254 RepID=A0AAV9UA60_9PEZI
MDALSAPNFWDPNDTRWKVNKCSLALFQGTQFDTIQSYWIGDPMTDMIKSPKTSCLSLDQLTLPSADVGQGSLYKIVNGYRIRGDCGCTFYEDDKCTKGLFDAVSRDDDDLPRTGNGDKTASLRCWDDPGAACSVQLYRYRSYNTAEGSPKSGPDNQQEYYPFALDPPGRCLPVPDPLKGQVTSLIQRYCARCRYYDNLDCSGNPLLEFGSGEAGEGDLKDIGPKIQAYQCDKSDPPNADS